MEVEVDMDMEVAMEMDMEVDKHIKKLLEVGTLTGSRAFNCSTSESDWDIVILYKDLPTDLSQYPIITHIDFDSLPDGKYYDTSECDALENDIEYDRIGTWGPICDMYKYIAPDSDVIVNLFVYASEHEQVLTMFQEVTNLMNFIYGSSLADKPTRIEAFIKVLESVGITNLK